MNYVRPDQCFEIPIQGGVLKISPSCDFMHHFPNQAWMLKYWDVEHNPSRMCNVFMDAGAASFLIQACNLDTIERTFMGEQEHDQWVGWSAMHNLVELDFIPEEEGGTSTL